MRSAHAEMKVRPMKTKNTITTTIAAGVVCLWVLVSGCSRQNQLGLPIPASVAEIKLEDLAKNPSAYKDREVVLDVNYGSYCCPSDFSCKQGMEGVEVVPKGFATPKSATGKPLRVYGIVRLGKHEEAGEKKEAEEKKEEKKGEEHHEYYIEAKGVQFK